MKDVHMKIPTDKALVSKSLLDHLQKEIAELQRELKHNTLYKTKFKQISRENQNTTKKYIESKELRKQ